MVIAAEFGSDWEGPMVDWNTSVHFGTGKQRGAGVTGFHRLNNGGVFSGVVYRGDDRAPEDGWISSGVFSTGFVLHEAGINVSGRVTSNIPQVNETHGTTRGIVSATTSIKMAAYWAVHNTSQEGWVYCMYIENEPWAAEASMNLKGTQGWDAAEVQKEIMFRELPGNRIYAARKVKKVGDGGPRQTYLVGNLIQNKGYQGTNPYGIAYKDDDFKLLINGGQQVLCE